MSQKLVYFFGDGNCEGDPQRKDLLGGKGASLAAMSKAGLPVPPGFTISVDCCALYHENGGKWPDGLEQEVRENLARLEQVTGREFGKDGSPLLVSVRSGAAVSMPGMMDTLLNCGLNPAMVEQMPDPLSFWRAYAQFIMMFARTTADIAEDTLDKAVAPILKGVGGDEGQLDAVGWRAMAGAYAELYESVAAKSFPDDPWELLVACIEAVFGSWNNERAITYRKAHDIRGVRGTAVNVQAMFPSRMSGIAFTANPTNPTASEIVIESAYGLGEAIVSGAVTPDHWVLDHETLAVKAFDAGTKGQVVASLDGVLDIEDGKPSLSDEQVLEVGRIALQVEEHFGYQVDIEWGWADGKFVLLQSRAVRGLEIALDVEEGRLAEVHRLRKLAGDEHRVWVIHNLAETLAAPMPLTWDIIRGFMSGNGGFGLMYQDFGYRPAQEVLDSGFLELICGRIYADPKRAAKLFWASVPMAYEVDEVLKDKSILESAPQQFDAAKADGRFLMSLPSTVVAMIKCGKRMKKAGASAKQIFDEQILPDYLKYIDEKRGQSLAELSTDQVIDELNDRRRVVLDDFGKESLKPGFFGGTARAAAEMALIQLMGEEKGGEVILNLTGGLEGDSTVDQNIFLYKVAKGEEDIEEFLARYGHRVTNEMELAEPRWREDAGYVRNMIAMFKKNDDHNPEDRHEINVKRRRECDAGLSALLAEYGGSCLLEDIQKDIADAQELLPYRETGKHYLMMGYELIRLAIVELGDRWDLGRDIFFLTLDELPRFEKERETLASEITKRKIRWQSARQLEMADLIDSDELDSLGMPRHFEDADELEGDALAGGVASGTAKIVFDPKEAGDLGSDAILICPSTDPGWTALFLNIKGLIVERGGALSHGAITARDFGIPAVTCPDATKRIKAGTAVRVDGNRGRITLIDEGGAK